MLLMAPSLLMVSGKIDVEAGTADVTVGSAVLFSSNFYGFGDSVPLGSYSDNSPALLSVDGVAGTLKQCYSSDGAGSIPVANNWRMEFLTEEERDAALDYITTEFTEFRDSASTFVLATSTASKNGNVLLDMTNSSGTNAFGSGDVGTTYTMGWY